MKIIDSSFVIPVLDGQIYLGQRGTEPHKGYWGAIGGKADPDSRPLDERTPRLIVKPGGSYAVSVADRIAMECGLECTIDAGVREFWEEVFSGVLYDPEKVTDVVGLGTYMDTNPEMPDAIFDLYFHVAKVHMDPEDVSLSPREILGFKPLEDLDMGQDKIWPGTRAALLHMKWAFGEYGIAGVDFWSGYERGGLSSQIGLEHVLPLSDNLNTFMGCILQRQSLEKHGRFFEDVPVSEFVDSI
ncbi:NUDIX hydrolase [Nanoarchaeota archaeon]